ncbi:nitroreductase [Desulfobulbus propionicus DSM 2032]|jgi:nitroreductase/NAD-dependent dihydropyrimidine dehydrogenase PreA subunit|uniref:Nitroreductase n=1 Tax=Desulfobulbus propionicus (strain ATCC 33891 / DSM 2032 / VKM B-1956 / 1pr3) TaxID=577650 RepID=A0A7U4DN82_DESPD|nr:nitroreductase family protein [Desulfobulbus propionicus]ADW16816.1 nitroreductase [Desulfobulbus propionicus DSM 2032]
MDLHFTIDRDLCIQCGACADDCPFHIIDLTDGYPALNPAREHHCIQCQHCLAVCPTAALSICGCDPHQSLPLPQSLPSGQQMEALIRGRRSVRRYHPEALDPALIADLLRTVANAPTGKNNRQCLFTVIEDRASMDVFRRETMEGLRRAVASKRLSEGLSYFRHVVTAWDQGKDIIFRNAPHLLMVSAPPTITTPDADLLIAMSYFELLAASKGIGTLWNAMIRWALATIDTDLYRLLGIPDDHVKGYTLLFGRPAVHYHRTVQRDEARINRVRLP